MAKRHHQSLHDIEEKVEGIKERFRLQSIEYRHDWSVSQFYACLTTFMIYADKWHDRLLSLRGRFQCEGGYDNAISMMFSLYVIEILFG